MLVATFGASQIAANTTGQTFWSLAACMGISPEKAAEALVNVDWDTTVLIFQRMNEESVANILAKMEPEAAAQLTEMLFAGTRRQVPNQE